MNNTNLRNWLQLPNLLDRAQRAFEKKSGWGPKEVRVALDNFSRLNGVSKALFGGLLVGQTLVRGGRPGAKLVGVSRSKTSVTHSAKKKSAQISADI